MGLLTYISYIAIVGAFAFVTLSLASGLLYVSELIEEHSRAAKVYGHNCSSLYPILLRLSTVRSDSIFCLLPSYLLAKFLRVVAIDFPNEARHSHRYYGSPSVDVPGFTQIASFFGTCVWLAPLFLFLSLSANDNALPVSAAEPGSPTNGASSMRFAQTRVSLFRSIFSLDSLPLLRPRGPRTDGLLAPHSQNPSRAPTYPPPSPTISHQTPIPPPPRSPGGKTAQLEGFLSPSSSFTLGNPPRRSPIMRRATGNTDTLDPALRRTSSSTSFTYDLEKPSTLDLASMYLHLAHNPRVLYLVTSSHDERLGRPRRALTFRAGSIPTQAVVELLRKDEIDLTNTVRLTSRVIKGCLGLISVEGDIFLALITSATEVGNTRPSGSRPESVAKIHEVSFFSLTSSTWDELSALPETSLSPEVADGVANREYAQTSTPPAVFEHPCMPLTKILSSGSFYYSMESTWDISSRLSIRLARDPSGHNASAFDERFVWNEYIVRSLLDFRDRLEPSERKDLDSCQFIVLAIQGYVGVFTMGLPAPPTNGSPTITTISLISRLGWKRAGTRFNTRGVDDDGNTANFVETETIFSTDQHCVSYVQIRGSVPLFWEQQGIQTFGQRIQITRPQASQPAFERHFSQLIEEYGAAHAINLLGTKENEQILTSTYGRHLLIARGSIADDLSITNFDFHNAVKIGGHDSVIRDLRQASLRLEAIGDHVDKFGFTMCSADSDEIITDQKGVFRTNCLDCLDRTNFVQDIISRTILEQYLLLVHREWIMSNTLWSYHRELWAENGDALSRIYAGTGALNTSFTRSGKRTLAGVLSDATKSVSRAYINNFQDKGKQIAIDMFLGNCSNQRPVTIFDPVHDSVRAALEQRLSEYSTTKQVTIFAGSWNLNGRIPSESLLPWLFPRDRSDDPDVFAIGFQEIVPLTAQQIVQTDPEKRRIWEKKIFETLDRRPNKKCDYVILRSEQLVGTALIILVKNDLLAVIRNVEAATRKTGLRGMSGNKGAVAIRLEYHDTTFCFLTAHLAAGHSNVEERNADYRTIAHGLHFQRGKTITSHDNVIWLGDMNYRIDMENFTVRGLAERDELDALLAADQLHIQLKQVLDSGDAFAGYTEGPILFRPTYRYDVGTDIYDTSEKQRVPAWTDRILYRGTQVDLSVYSRAELRGSDHKPGMDFPLMTILFAIFRAEIRIIDAVKRHSLSRLLFNSIASGEEHSGEQLDEKLASLVFPSDITELPPPSSDDFSWWDGPECPNGVLPIHEFLRVPVRRKSNPFDSPDDSPLSSSPTSSDEELYTNALSLPTPIAPTQAERKPPPPPPPPRSTKPAMPSP
ncbi:hypothetical protein H0H93_000043 [Arthromyces matolae]|nr:hypothetical protein H0H93_000043 [Arthromyces matolae]